MPPPHWPQLVFGWFESIEQPPHALSAPALLQVTASVPEHPHVPPPHMPHTVFGWLESVVHPPQAFTGVGLLHTTVS
jgi:hypothetical protein